MTTVRQMTLDEYSELRWCKSHRRYDCPHHSGRRGYQWLPEDIMSAMRLANAEMRRIGEIKPMYPHDVWEYMGGELPHVQTMRKYMKKLASEAKLIRVGIRGGYLLPNEAQYQNICLS